MRCKTARQVLEEFDRQGISISEWSRLNGFNRQTVVYVLREGAARRGEAHNVAVALGMKHGEIRRVERGAAERRAA